MACKDKTLIAFIIDRSGSMTGNKSAVIEGFNMYMLEQRNAAGSAEALIVLFDDRYEVLYDKVDVKNIPDLDDNTYIPRGTTALFDAIGRTIVNIKDYISTIEEDKRPEKVLFVITTDGQENASTDFTLNRVSEAIKFQREVDHWEFIFTGSDLESIKAAQLLNIPEGNVCKFVNDSEGTLNVYKKMSDATNTYRGSTLNSISSNLFNKED